MKPYGKWLVLAALLTAGLAGRGISQDREKAIKLCDKGTKARRQFTTEGYRDAVEAFTKAVAADSNYFGGYAGRASSYALWGYEMEKSGQDSKSYYQIAIRDGLKAVGLDSNAALAHRALGQAYLNADPKTFGQAAYEEITRAIALDSSDAASFYLLWLHTDNDNPNSPYIRKSLALDNDFFQSHYGLGLVYVKAKDFDKAVEHYKQAVRINPNHPLPYYSLGNAYSQQKKYDLAITEYEKALKIKPDLNDAYLYLGLAYYYENNDKDAAGKLTRYLELVPMSTYRTMVENILKEIE